MKNLTSGNIYKTFIFFAIPMVLAGILSQGYNIIDTVIAGRYLGNKGLAELGASTAFISLVSSAIWGYNAGCSIYVAKLFGAKNYDGLKNVIYGNIAIVFAFSALMSLLVVIFRMPIIDFLKTDSEVREGAALYMAIYTAGLFFIVMNHFFTFMLNALGSSGFPFVMSLLSAVLNIFGNLLSVAVFDMGVTGLALSTVLSAVIADIFYYIKIRSCFRQMGILKHKLRLNLSQIKISCRYALPVVFQQMMMYLVSMLISPMINVLGSSATAGYSVVSKIYDINANIYQNSAKTLSNYTAQCVGAGKQKYLKRGVRVGLLQGIMFLSPVLIPCIIFSEKICGMFFSEGEGGAALEYAVLFVKFYLPFIVFNLVNNLFHSFFRGAGAMRLLIISTATGAVSRLIFSFILSGTFAMNGIYSAWVLSWLAEAIFVSSIYLSGRWKKECLL